MRYEHRSQPLLSRRLFMRRLLLHSLVAFGVMLLSLLVGIFGYHWLVGLSWVDSLLNSAMILGGMGPVNAINGDSGKVFASFYALFSGVIFLVFAGIIIAPLAHRLLHRLHLEIDEIDAPPIEQARGMFPGTGTEGLREEEGEER